MSIANRFNSSSVKFNYEIPETHNFVKPSELVTAHGLEQAYTVRSMYVNTKGKYGDEPVIICDECLLNAPQHTLDAVREILQDSDAIDAINNGKLGFKFYQYKNKYGEQYSLTWIDL